MKTFNKGDRVLGYVAQNRPAYGTVEDPKTPYGMVKVDWDDSDVEDYHLNPDNLYPTTLEEERAEDIQMAQSILQKHGYGYRIYGPDTVHKMLDSYAEDPDEPLDTTTYRKEITDHVMLGDDWAAMSNSGEDADDAHNLLWEMVAGTQHDHPEWFGKM